MTEPFNGRLGRLYTLSRKLSGAGMSSVWVVEMDKEAPTVINVGAGVMHTRFVLKISTGNNPGLHDLFQDEARIGMLLSQPGHPNLVRTVELLRIDGQPAILMEYVKGKTLGHVIKQPVPWPNSGIYALDVLAQIALGLNYVHRCTSTDGDHLQLVHGDVKPHNILISDTGVAKLVDFGIATFNGQRYPVKPNETRGTPSYMSPEQATAKPLDGRSDIFTLGTILYEIVMGRQAFCGHSFMGVLQRIATGNHQELINDVWRLDVNLGYILEKCWYRDPNKRYQTGGELALVMEYVRERLLERYRSVSAPKMRITQ